MYLILMFFNIFLYFIKIKKKVFLIWIIISFTLLWGLRYDVGIDYINYEFLFYSGLPYGELGYKFIERIARNFGNQFYIVTLITSFITIVPISKYLENSKYDMETLKIGNILLYLSEFGFASANLMRQGITISLFILATQIYKQKKYKLFTVIILIGMLFHKSILLAVLLLIFIDYLKITKIQGITVIILIYGAKFIVSYTNFLLILIKYINRIYPQYNSEIILNYASRGTMNEINIGILLQIFIFMIILIQQKQKEITLNGKFFMFSILIRVLSTHNFIFNRIGFYFIIFVVPFFMDYLKAKGINKKNKKITTLLVIIPMMILFIKGAYFSPVRSKITYKSIIFLK